MNRRDKWIFRVLLVWSLVWYLGGVGYFVYMHLAVPQFDTSIPRLSPPDPDFGWEYGAPLVSPPLDHPPKFVYLDGEQFEIRYTTPEFLHSHGLAAMAFFPSKLIYLDQQDPDLRESLVHELLHMGWRSANPSLKWVGQMQAEFDPVSSNQHEWIVPMSPVLVDLVEENPKLVRWLGRGPYVPQFLASF